MGDEAMSAPIQRYDFHDGYLEDDAEGRFIRYADHVRVVAEAVQAVIKAGEEEAYALAHIHSGDQQLAVRLILEAQRATTPREVGAMWIKLHIVCDRCKQVVKDAMKGNGSTAGYYEISGGRWGTIEANDGEKYLCDACMHADPRYQAEYGTKVQP